MPVWFCMRSKDYVADIARAPKDVKAVVFVFSDIPKLKVDSFTPLANNLEVLMIINSNLEDIEDNAMKGLTSMKEIILSGNKLTTLKAAWFQDMTNLKKMEVRDNMIKTIDEEMASLMQNLEILDIRENEMKCMTVDFLNKMTKIKTMRWELNAWHMRCIREIMMWAKEKGIMFNDKKIEEVESITISDIKTCIDEMTKDGKVDDKEIDKCVVKAMEKMMEEKKIDMTK